MYRINEIKSLRNTSRDAVEICLKNLLAQRCDINQTAELLGLSLNDGQGVILGELLIGEQRWIIGIKRDYNLEDRLTYSVTLTEWLDYEQRKIKTATCYQNFSTQDLIAIMEQIVTWQYSSC